MNKTIENSCFPEVYSSSGEKHTLNNKHMVLDSRATIPQLGLKQQQLIVPQFWSQKSEIKMPTGLAPLEAHEGGTCSNLSLCLVDGHLHIVCPPSVVV